MQHLSVGKLKHYTRFLLTIIYDGLIFRGALYDQLREEANEKRLTLPLLPQDHYRTQYGFKDSGLKGAYSSHV